MNGPEFVAGEVSSETARENDYWWRQWAFALLGVLVLILVSYYGARSLAAVTQGPQTLVVYGFSTLEESFNQEIFPQFERAWEAQNGRDLAITGVFGPSGTLAEQINLGAPADIAVLSNPQHARWLKAGRQVNQDREPVLISTTPMVIVVRPGNPIGIADFSDLARPGLELLHATPVLSGGGDWSLFAEYGSAWLASGDQAAAEEQVLAIWANVQIVGSSARAAMTLFELGTGDALVTYEQDALLAQARGVPLEIVRPARTIQAQHVALLVDANVSRTERPVAEAFLQFLTGPEGQQALGRYHLRPAAADPAPVSGEFTIADLGGWSLVYQECIEKLWRSEIAPRVESGAIPQFLNEWQGVGDESIDR